MCMNFISGSGCNLTRMGWWHEIRIQGVLFMVTLLGWTWTLMAISPLLPDANMRLVEYMLLASLTYIIQRDERYVPAPAPASTTILMKCANKLATVTAILIAWILILSWFTYDLSSDDFKEIIEKLGCPSVIIELTTFLRKIVVSHQFGSIIASLTSYGIIYKGICSIFRYFDKFDNEPAAAANANDDQAETT